MNARRYLAVASREWRQMRRDRVFSVLAFLVPAVLMTVFTLGLSMDVENLPIAIVDYDRTVASRDFSSIFIESRYFDFKGYLENERAIPRLFQESRVRAVLIIPPLFEQRLGQRRSAPVQTLLDGVFPSRAQTVIGYVQGLVAGYNEKLAKEELLSQGQQPAEAEAQRAAVVPQVRYMYNEALSSDWSLTPKLIMFVLMVAAPLLSAVGIVSEKESGSITTIRASTITPLEYMLGKVTPYVAVSTVNSVLLWGMAVFLFGVPFRGSPLLFLIACVLFSACTTGIGLVVSAFTRSQVAAVLITFIITTVPAVQFSGIFTPISFLHGGAKVIAYSLPAMHFVDIVTGVFLKDIGLEILWTNFAVLTVYALVLLLLGVLTFTKRPKD